MIRLATEEDFDSIKQLADELQKETIYSNVFKGFELTPEIVKYYITASTEHLGLLSIDNETQEVIGFAVFDIIKPWSDFNPEAKIARISLIYIKPKFRSKGYGKELKEAFEYWGQKVGAKALAIGKTKVMENVSENSSNYTKLEELFIKEIN